MCKLCRRGATGTPDSDSSTNKRDFREILLPPIYLTLLCNWAALEAPTWRNDSADPAWHSILNAA